MKKRSLLFAGAIFLFSFFLIYYRTYAINLSSRYAYDEISWIGRGYYADLLLRGDLKNPLWKDCYIDTDPKLPSYVYGLSYYGQYLKAKRLNQKLDSVSFLMNRLVVADKFICPEVKKKFSASTNKNLFFKDRKKMDKTALSALEETYGPSFHKVIPLLLSARKTAVIMTTFSIIVIFFTVFLIERNLLLALITAFIVGSSDLFLLFGTVAYSEPIFILLMNLALLLLVLIGTKDPPHLFISVVFGTVVGLLNQAKINGVMMLFVYLFILLILFIKNLIFSLPIKKIVSSFILSIFFFLIVFLFTDPTLLANPIKSVLYKYQYTQIIALYQQEHNQKIALTDTASRLRYISSYYFSHPPFLNFYDQYNDNHHSFLYRLRSLFLLFFLFGLTKLIASSLKDLRSYFLEKDAFLSKRTIIFICFIVFFISLLNYLVLALRRYLIHMNFFIVYCAIIGCYWMISLVAEIFVQKSKHGSRQK